MRCVFVAVILASFSCLAASHCPDPQLREAKIGGDAIFGGVSLHKKPLRFARVRLYSSSGKILWIGKTNKHGTFEIRKLVPGDYRLEVDGWGTTTVRLNPELAKPNGFGQVPAWNLLLTDHACVSTMAVMN